MKSLNTISYIWTSGQGRNLKDGSKAHFVSFWAQEMCLFHQQLLPSSRASSSITFPTSLGHFPSGAWKRHCGISRSRAVEKFYNLQKKVRRCVDIYTLRVLDLTLLLFLCFPFCSFEYHWKQAQWSNGSQRNWLSANFSENICLRLKSNMIFLKKTMK